VTTSRHIVFVLTIICSVFSLYETVNAQVDTVKKKKRENVFLHPRKFYQKYFPHLKIKSDPPDSTYIRTYPNYLSISAYVLSPAIGIDIAPSNTHTDGALKLRTSISDILGFSANYKFVGAGFAFLLNSGAPSHDNYTKSRYRTATIKYNSRGYSMQFKYVRFKGLTDIARPAGMDPLIGPIKRPDIVNKEFQFEWLYNPRWRKYSYIAPLTFSQRQIKSSSGFLFQTGVYFSQLSSDSPLVDPTKAQYYGDFKNVKVIRTLSIRLAPGLGSNLVFFKRYYLSIAVFPSYDLYFYKYLQYQDEKVKGRRTFMFVLDGKASLGYHSERIYGGLRIEAERRSASLRGIDMDTMYTYLGVELGYRFNTPRIVKKVYRETMPPEM
jgi:hypothetical protein